jgi:hypothetical protein
VSWDGNRLSPTLTLKLALLYCLRWLVRVMMADVPVAGAPTAITASFYPITQGLTPPLVRPRRWPGESLLHAGARLGLLLCRDVNFSC